VAPHERSRVGSLGIGIGEWGYWGQVGVLRVFSF
jgi:hypothetical protein